HHGQEIKPGIGGKAVFLTGAIGGLMTSGWVDMHDPWLDTIYPAEQPSFDKAMVHGHRLAELILDLADSTWVSIDQPTIRLSTQTILFDV
ncbi:MAG TPA: hypothetical protein PKD85_21790, partial [Saprospiraceae bacterium]|nr:hypothetical protein [Saprospiraceae bacterium]